MVSSLYQPLVPALASQFCLEVASALPLPVFGSQSDPEDVSLALEVY
jgi:hypothetical protein